MFTERQVKVLGILKQYKSGITSDEIARLCGVSSKTIRTDIKGIMAELDVSLAVIRSSTRNGFSLDIHDIEGMSRLLKKKDSQLIEGKARNTYILQQLLHAALSNTSIRQQDMADSLYIGLSTLKASIKDVKADLSRYHAAIVNHKNRGMILSGEEKDIRHCIFDYLMSDALNREMLCKDLEQPESIRIIRQILIRVTSSYDVVLTDDSLENVLDYVLISLCRSGSGNNVTYKLQESKHIESQHEFAMASAIYEQIYKELHIDVMTSEIYYLAQHIIASKRYTPTDSQPMNEYAQKLTDEMLERVYQIVGTDFRGDTTLREGLRTHLETVIPRIRFHIHIQNEVLNVVKNEYPLAFQIGVISSKVIEAEEKLTVSEDEIGFLAVHFGAALSRSNIEKDSSDRRRAIIVCGSGMGTAVLLKARLEEHLKNVLLVDRVIPGYQLKTANLDHIDIIISTITSDNLPGLAAKDQDKLVIVRHFLNEAELESIRRRLFQTNRISGRNVERFFRRECFVTGKSFQNKEQVLQFMTGSMEGLGFMDHETSQSVFEREQSSSTEIGNLVAIPHPMENHTAISAIYVVVMERPMVWTDHHVQVVFLISIAKAEFYLWEPIFLKLFQYFVKDNGIRQVISHPDYDSFIRNFKDSF